MRSLAVLLAVVMSVTGIPLAYSDHNTQDLPVIVIDATGHFTALEPNLLTPPVAQGSGITVANDAPLYLLVGNTTITWVVEYDTGSVSVYRQTVTVRDAVPPECPVLEELEYSAKRGKSIPVEFDFPVMTDNTDLDVEVTASHKSGSKFRVGNHTVTFTGTDDSGNSVDCPQTVRVSPLVVENLSLSRTTDKIRATWDMLLDHTTYRLELTEAESGEWLQRLTVDDNTHTFVNLESDTGYTVSVRAAGDKSTETSRTTSTLPLPPDPYAGDTTPPVIDPPRDISREATAPLTPVSFGLVIVTDNEDPYPTLSSNAPRLFPVGATIVTWWAIDRADNRAEVNQTVTIRDTIPPTLSNLPSSATYQTGSPDGIAVDFDMPVATDIADPDVTVKSSHTPGDVFTVGNTTVTFTATDDSGNTASHEIVVTVSHITKFQTITDGFSNLDQWTVSNRLCDDGTDNRYKIAVGTHGNPAPSVMIAGDADCGYAILSRNVDTSRLGDDDLFIGMDFKAQAPRYYNSTDNPYFNATLLVGRSDVANPETYEQVFSNQEWRSFRADITHVADGSDELVIGLIIHDSRPEINSMILHVDNFYIGTTPPPGSTQ